MDFKRRLNELEGSLQPVRPVPKLDLSYVPDDVLRRVLDGELGDDDKAVLDAAAHASGLRIDWTDF